MAWDEIKQGAKDKHHYQTALEILNKITFDNLNLKQKKNYCLAKARVFEGQRNFAQALQELNKISQSLWDDAIHHCHGSILRKLGRSDDANKAFSKAHHVLSLIDQAFDAIRKGQNIMALQLLEKVDFRKLSPYEIRNYHLAKSSALKNMARYDEALEELDKIPEKLRNQSTEMSRAFCIEKQGDLKQAGRILKNISNEADPKIVTALSVLDDKKGKSKSAAFRIEELIDFDNITEADTENLIALARCRQKTGDLNAAKEAIQSIKNLYSNKKAVLALARIYAYMGKYSEAEATIKGWSDWLKDKDMLLTLARFNEETDRFDSASQNLMAIEDWENDRIVLLALGRCYYTAGKLGKAEKTFQKIEGWEEDSEVLLSLAYCKSTQKYYDEAIVYFQKIRNWQENFHASLGVIRCQQALAECNMEASYEELSKQFPHNPQAQLSAIVYQESLDVDPEIIKRRYTKFVSKKKFSDYLPGYYNYCRFLVERKDPLAWRYLHIALKKFNYSASFYLLKAKMYREQDKLEECLRTLISSTQQFPFHVATYLELIRHHLLSGDVKKAALVKKSCLALFVGHKRLAHRIDKLFETIPFIRVGGYHDLSIISCEEEMSADVPSYIQNPLQSLMPLPGKTYLVGSGVLALIPGNEIPIYDVDVVNSSLESAVHLKGNGFSSDRYHQYAYKKFLGPLSIDVLIVDNTDNEMIQRLGLFYHALKRDFTICSLLSDGKTITDPTGMGIQDAIHRRLRMIGHATLRFAEDPSLLVRAAYYIALGYTPVPELASAMHKFKDKIGSLHIGHIEDLARKYLSRDSASEFIKVLEEYGLYQKLFGFAPQETLRGSEQALREYLGIPEGLVTKPINATDTIAVEHKGAAKGALLQEQSVQEKENAPSLYQDESETLTQKMKEWTPFAEVAKRKQQRSECRKNREISTPPENDQEMRETLNTQKNVMRRRKAKGKCNKLKAKVIVADAQPEKIDVAKMVRNVVDKISEEYSYDIHPIELETAKKLMISILKCEYQHIFIMKNKDVLEKKIYELFSRAIYRKAPYQFLLCWNGCHSYGMRLDQTTYPHHAISKEGIKSLMKSSTSSKNSKKRRLISK